MRNGSLSLTKHAKVNKNSSPSLKFADWTITLTLSTKISNSLLLLMVDRKSHSSDATHFNSWITSFFYLSFPKQVSVLRSSFSCSLAGTKPWLSQSLILNTIPFIQSHFCVVCCSPNSADFSIFDLLSPSPESLPVTDPRSHFANHECLVHSSATSVMRREAEQLVEMSYLSELLTSPHITDQTGGRVHTLLSLISTKILLFLIVLAPRTTLIILSANFTRQNPPHSSRHTFRRCNSADWDGFLLSFLPQEWLF